jgi:hypothetical protein
MEKAYDVKALVEKLKARGLDVAEDIAGEVLEAVFEFFQESAVMSENKYDDLVLAILPMLKAEALKAIDKIDGKIDA